MMQSDPRGLIRMLAWVCICQWTHALLKASRKLVATLLPSEHRCAVWTTRLKNRLLIQPCGQGTPASGKLAVRLAVIAKTTTRLALEINRTRSQQAAMRRQIRTLVYGRMCQVHHFQVPLLCTVTI